MSVDACWECHAPVASDQFFCSQCSAPLKLNKYRVLGKLGSGTFGAVYQCEDLDMDRSVAVKLLYDPMRESDKQELVALARLDHPGVVRVYHADPDAGLIVMEFVEGQTLEYYLENDPKRITDAFSEIFLAIFEAIRIAHQAGIIHRDLKPANIIIRPDNSPKIADFGLARLLEPHELVVNTYAGSPAYMAPEVLDGKPYSFEADVHSIGCVMYECLANRLPFNARTETGLVGEKSLDPVPVRERNSGVDDLISDLITRMITSGDRRIPRIETAAQLLRQARPGARYPAVLTVDSYQDRLGIIYTDKNNSASALDFLSHYMVAHRAIAEAVGSQDAPALIDASIVPKAFAWICALSTSLNARVGELIWLKYDGICPYCLLEKCGCKSGTLTREARNRALLASKTGRKMSDADAAKTVSQYQAIFRRIYGDVNDKSGTEKTFLHSYSEIAEAMEAIQRLELSKKEQSLLILHLEVSDVIAWFFAILNSLNPDFDFDLEFERVFRHGCYVCLRTPCGCATELLPREWRP